MKEYMIVMVQVTNYKVKKLNKILMKLNCQFHKQVLICFFIINKMIEIQNKVTRVNFKIYFRLMNKYEIYYNNFIL